MSKGLGTEELQNWWSVELMTGEGLGEWSVIGVDASTGNSESLISVTPNCVKSGLYDKELRVRRAADKEKELLL